MLTIFTPAYNRAEKLNRLYESLLHQSSHDFEWLIVDDGSTDATRCAVKGFANNGGFPVRYYFKENGGKHTAYNFALELAEGAWFFCVDSDDYLSPNAVAEILSAARDLKENQGILAYKQDVNERLLSEVFPQGVQFSKMYEMAQKHHCCGEFSLIFPTDLAKKYPFPVFAGERFVTESVIYDRIDRECEMLLLPKVVTICEYQQDGYSNNANAVMKKNPNGYCLYFLQRIDLQSTFVSRLMHAGKYWCFRWISKNRSLKYEGKNKLLTGFAVMPGLLFRVYYKLIRKI